MESNSIFSKKNELKIKIIKSNSKRYMNIYQKFDISSNGFLPENSLKPLPKYFEQWENIAANIPNFIKGNCLRNKVNDLPLLDWQNLNSKYFKRAYSVLAIIASSYVWCEGFNNVPSILPKNIAIPLWRIAEQIGIKPIITHASLDLFNWRLIDSSKGITLDNLRSVYTMTGKFDEEWFYLIPVVVEKIGADVLDHIIKVLELIKKNDKNNIAKSLHVIKENLIKIKQVLLRMSEKCEPNFFYNTMRPYLAGWNNEHFAKTNGLIYEGISKTPQKFVGGSVTQSSLFQTIDAFFGIVHDDSYFDKIKDYMPSQHKKFIYYVKEKSTLKEYINKNKDIKLKTLFESLIKELVKIRKVHYGLVHKYVLKFIKKNNYLDDKGTGGTPLKSFLKGAIDNSKKIIEK